MTNLHNDYQNNLVSFLRHNQPVPPDPHLNLEQRLINSLEPQRKQRRFCSKAAWTIPRAVATGFLFTSVSFGLKTPRIALEPKDLENFLVKNWYDTLDGDRNIANETAEAYWLLPSIPKSQAALSVAH